jgi:steroid delta-isomerase-like uncharacterized protein
MRWFRVLLSVALVVMFGLMVVGTQLRALGQEWTPAASPAAVPPLIQHWLDAVNAHDGIAVAALYAEDGTHEDVPSLTTVHGREEIAALIDGVQSQFRDLRLQPVATHQVGDLAVLEHAFSAIDLETGRPLAFRGVVVFELDADQIRRSVEYYDVATILGQLGLLEMGDQSGAATPAP